MPGHVILVIMDGIGYETAIRECGFLEGAVELGWAKRWKMRAALPTISAPLYETLHTGLSPLEHGVVGNEALRPSIKPNVFHSLHDQGFRTAAVAHSYFFTLYNRRFYDPISDIEVEDESLPIQYARFYSMEGYGKTNPCSPAEIDMCAQVTMLVKKHQPNYLLYHTCAGDTLGHIYTSDSAEYRKQAWHIDNALSRTLPLWLEAGYEVLVTADHGMNTDGHHGGTGSLERDVPFYYFGQGNTQPEGDVLDQLGVAPTILSRVGAEIPETMKADLLIN
ncbi:alkaline phosphatase family protein [Coralliovum pocilloporae]|uniref:alkaline phosphatase family protein n=1 Tax=Coralliovum pocilloporae TaxID=3066369 RepID=UPI003306A678